VKTIMLVSHCILNSASKVRQDESGLREEYALREKFLRRVLEQNVQLIQLPCPEFVMYGTRRWGHVRAQFDHPFYRKTCRELLEPVMLQLREYASAPEDFRLAALVSVEGSPSCGWELTCEADWGGELDGKSPAPVKMTRRPGVMMEIAAQMLRENGTPIPICSLREATELLCDSKNKE
jgi:predicted secreted protein